MGVETVSGTSCLLVSNNFQFLDSRQLQGDSCAKGEGSALFGRSGHDSLPSIEALFLQEGWQVDACFLQQCMAPAFHDLHEKNWFWGDQSSLEEVNCLPHNRCKLYYTLRSSSL